MSACGSCKNIVNRNDINKVTCDLCKKIYHTSCENMVANDLAMLSGRSWICSLCIKYKRLQRTSSESTSVKYKHSDYGVPVPAAMSSSDIKCMIDNSKSEILQGHKKIEDDVSVRFSAVLEKLQSYHEILKKQDDTISKQRDQIISLSKKTDMLKNKIRSIESKADEQEQYSRRNTLELYGVPEEPGENLRQIAVDVCQALKVEADEKSFDYVHRLRKRRNHPASVIVMKLVRRRDADRILQQSKRTKNISIRQIGFQDDGIIYINQSLTAPRRLLFTKAKDVQKKEGLQYVWVDRVGRIKVKADESSAVMTLRSEDDLAVFMS